MTLILNGTDNSATTPAVTGTDTDTGVYYPAANQVALATAGTQAMLANASQGVQFANAIGVGATTPTTSGAGVTFPATANLSTNANTLDDYEEGTFTPVLGGSGSDPTGVTYVAQAATYTRIGNLVTVFAYIAWTTYTGGSGNLAIKGLPFAAVNSTAGGYCNGSTQISTIPLSSGYSWASMRTAPNQTFLDLQQQGSGNSWTTVTYSAITTSGTKEMLTSVTYFLN